MSTSTGTSGFLTRRGAIPIAFASVVGAGIMSLPSAIYHRAGPAAIIVWLVAVALCLPMIMLFQDSVRSAAGDDPLRDAVRRGLGRTASNAVPGAFLLVVVVGLPSNAVIAGRVLAAAIGHGQWSIWIAALLLAVGLLVNLCGGKASARAQAVGVAVLVASLILAAGWAVLHASRTPDMTPGLSSLSSVPPGVLVAFWAFVGFENLTFLSRDLRHPRRDFLPVCLVALGLLTLLAALLTMCLSLQLSPANTDPVTGLVRAVSVGSAGRIVGLVMAIAGVVSILLNTLAWLRGVALVADGAARDGALPRSLASGDVGNPSRALIAMSAGFAVTLIVIHLHPTLVVPAIASASGVFVIIYLGCIATYLRSGASLKRRFANALLVPILLASLIASGWRAVYPVLVLVAVVCYAVSRSRRTSSDTAPG